MGALTVVHRERGVALIAVLLALLLMGALGGALILTTTIETTIAANFRRTAEGRAAADAIFDRALVDLAGETDWTSVLAGGRRSSFADGAPTGGRQLADGTTLDLDVLVSMANCRRARPCTASELSRVSGGRPWGANNPTWQLYAFGPLADLAPAGAGVPGAYVVAMVGDDPSETDAEPLVDGGSAAEEGRGVVMLRAQAYGPWGVQHGVQATIRRAGLSGVQVESWTIQSGAF